RPPRAATDAMRTTLSPEEVSSSSKRDGSSVNEPCSLMWTPTSRASGTQRSEVKSATKMSVGQALTSVHRRCPPRGGRHQVPTATCPAARSDACRRSGRWRWSHLPEMAVRIGEHGCESPWLFDRFHDDLCTGTPCPVDHCLYVATVRQCHHEKALTLT